MSGRAAAAAALRRLCERLPLRPDLAADWPLLLIGAAVLALTCYRAASTGITYDEAETYLRYVEKSGHADPHALFGFLSVQRANNHPLNTMLIDVTSALFRYDELAIRLPNLLMFAAYLWLAAGLARGRLTGPLVFGLLALNYCLAEFFGLARGYGLSAGLVLAALAVRPAPAGNEGGLRLSLWLLLLASLANFAAFALLVAFGLEALLARGARFVARALAAWSSLAGALLVGFILYAFAAVSEAGKPLFGDLERGFWEPVVGSYLRMFAPGWTPSRALLVGVGLAVLALLLSHGFGRLRDFHLGRCLLVLLALVTAASHLLGKPMPTERVLLPFWPLLALAIAEALEGHARRLVQRRAALAGPLRGVALLGLLGLGWAFARQADATGTRDWREDYALAATVRGHLGRGECLKRRYLGHPVTNFYVKQFGRSLEDPSLVCPRVRKPLNAR